MNEMDKLFGVKTEKLGKAVKTEPPRPAAPKPAAPGRSTIEQAAKAVSKRKRESERNALMHEVLIVIGTLVVVAVSFYAFRAYLRHKGELERRQHEYVLAEMAKAEEAERRRIADAEAFMKREREKRAKEQAEAERLRKEREERLAAEEKARGIAARFNAVKNMLRGSRIDYFRNAGDADRPSKAAEKSQFICLFPGGDVYEVVIDPGKPVAAAVLSEKAPPEPVTEEAFARLSAKKPYVIMRDYGEQRIEPKSYLVRPSAMRRNSPKVHPAPSATEEFNPSKVEFGELYDTVRGIGMSRTAFKYGVVFTSKAFPDEVEIPQTFDFGRGLTRANLVREVDRAVRRFKLKHKGERIAGDLPGEIGRAHV